MVNYSNGNEHRRSTWVGHLVSWFIECLCSSNTQREISRRNSCYILSIFTALFGHLAIGTKIYRKFSRVLNLSHLTWTRQYNTDEGWLLSPTLMTACSLNPISRRFKWWLRNYKKMGTIWLVKTGMEITPSQFMREHQTRQGIKYAGLESNWTYQQDFCYSWDVQWQQLSIPNWGYSSQSRCQHTLSQGRVELSNCYRNDHVSQFAFTPWDTICSTSVCLVQSRPLSKSQKRDQAHLSIPSRIQRERTQIPSKHWIIT